MTTLDTTQLLPDAVRHRLDALMFNAHKIRAGAMKGERRSVKRGTSIEFADYRNYTPGDDLRKLDWNVYARLDKPYIKLLEDEEDLAVHLLIDTSASMDWQPEDKPDAHKLLYARRLAAALAYIALMTNDRLTLHTLNSTNSTPFGPARGRGQIVQMLRYAHGLAAEGVTDLNAALRTFALREKRPGLVFILSDMFSQSGYVDGLNLLLGKGHEIVVLHLLSPDEVMPPLTGDLRLIDVETGLPQEVTIDATLRTAYQQRLENWLNDLRDDCARRGVHYLMTQTNAPFEQVILYDLRRLGIVK
jgi:uncharacterized protein (DUF58 family)